MTSTLTSKSFLILRKQRNEDIRVDGRMVRGSLFSIERRRVRVWQVRVVGESETRIELLHVEPERGESLELQQTLLVQATALGG